MVRGQADASLSVNLDPNGDGIGGLDHEVMLEGGAKFGVEFGDQLQFNIPGETTGVLQWSSDGQGSYRIHFGLGREVNLAEFLAEFAESSKAGDILHKVIKNLDISAMGQGQVRLTASHT